MFCVFVCLIDTCRSEHCLPDKEAKRERDAERERKQQPTSDHVVYMLGVDLNGAMSNYLRLALLVLDLLSSLLIA